MSVGLPFGPPEGNMRKFTVSFAFCAHVDIITIEKHCCFPLSVCRLLELSPASRRTPFSTKSSSKMSNSILVWERSQCFLKNLNKAVRKPWKKVAKTVTTKWHKQACREGCVKADDIYTALSRKVVRKKCKSAHDNPERYCGYFQGILRKWLVTPWTCVCGSKRHQQKQVRQL